MGWDPPVSHDVQGAIVTERQPAAVQALRAVVGWYEVVLVGEFR